MMAFGCGGSLLAWGLWTARPELWMLGIPTALVGQVLLLVGLVLQLDSLRDNTNAAQAKLRQVDQQLQLAARRRKRRTGTAGAGTPVFRIDPGEGMFCSTGKGFGDAPPEWPQMSESLEG